MPSVAQILKEREKRDESDKTAPFDADSPVSDAPFRFFRCEFRSESKL